jgi:hypothetical protein
MRRRARRSGCAGYSSPFGGPRISARMMARRRSSSDVIE